MGAWLYCDALVREISVQPDGTDVRSSKVGLASCIANVVVNVPDVTHITLHSRVCVAAISCWTSCIKSLLCNDEAALRALNVTLGLQLSDLEAQRHLVIVQHFGVCSSSSHYRFYVKKSAT